ncbi:hypothetical protein, partial [Pseudomonas putida]
PPRSHIWISVLQIEMCCCAFDPLLSLPLSALLKPSEWTNNNHDIIWRAGDGYGGEYHDVDKP